MTVSDRIFAKDAVLICIPVVFAAALLAAFLVKDVPRIASDGRERIDALTENAIKTLRDDPSAAEFTWRRGQGVVAGDAKWNAMFPASMTWKEWNAQTGARTKTMSGWRDIDGRRLVWTRGQGADDALVYASMTDIDLHDWTFAAVALVLALFAAVAALAAAGIAGLRRNAKARDDFLAAAAHDLSTPLAAMRIMIGRDDAAALKLNERMSRIVDNIKDFMLSGGNRRKPLLTRFDMVAAYREAYEAFRDDYRDLFDGADVEFTSPFDSLETLGDPTLAVQIIWNILGNDLKYAAPYGKVAVELAAADGYAVMRFRDRGKGMSRREMEKAFDRYYRARTVLESGKGGFGIGLAVAKDFAVAMGGNLTLGPNEPNGLVYVLSLPLAPPDAPADNTARSDIRDISA